MSDPGDLLLVQTNHFVSKLIRFGQRSYGPEYARFNHVAVHVGQGQLVEALTSGVVLSPVDKYPAENVRLVHPSTIGNVGLDGAHAMRENAAIFAHTCVGESYGWGIIAAIALKVLFKGRWSFGIRGTKICSGLAGQCLERMGYDFEPYEARELTPAFLAKRFDA